MIKSISVQDVLEFGLDGKYLHLLDGKIIEPLIQKLNEIDVFFYIKSEDNNNNFFITKEDLFDWFVNLNIRLARKKLYRISKNHLNCLFKMLCPNHKIKDPTDGIIQFGHQHGLIGYDFDENYYFFPLARTLTLIKINFNLAVEILKSQSINDISQVKIENAINELMNVGFSMHKSKVVNIIKEREGLANKQFGKLRKLAGKHNLSPEGIRKRELKFWEQLEYCPERYLLPFLKAMILTVLSRQGSLIQYIGGEKEYIFRFLCKCADVEYIELREIELLLISDAFQQSKHIFSICENFELDFDKVVMEIKEVYQSRLSLQDLFDVAKRVLNYRREKIKATQRIYLALKKIGKPAHYSKITKVHNKMFTENSNSEYNIHSCLARGEYGVVWIGVKGMYALKEWGFNHPEMKLFDRVVLIVSDLFKKTKRPVSFNTITAEIGKYRKIVNINSLKFAVYLNPKLKRSGEDKFIPKDDEKIKEEEQKKDNVENAFSLFVNEPITQVESKKKEIQYKAFLKCESCKNIESHIILKDRIVYLRCCKCQSESKYPSGLWGVHTNIPCPKCNNDFIIGFHRNHGPYLKCKKCGLWGKIYKYL